MANVVQTWAEAVARRLGVAADEVDRARLQEGFAELVATVESWPAPAVLLRLMPSRGAMLTRLNGPEEEPKQLERLQTPEEQQERLREMMATVLDGRVVNSGVVVNERARHLQVVRDKAL